jgi:protocatechuate 4,5-dioxygenase, alpha chain
MDGEIPGTTVFTGERSRQGYRLNRMAMSLSDPANRQRFCADETAYMTEMGLSDAQQDAVRRRDWAAMIAQGGNIYLLLKIGATVGQSVLDCKNKCVGRTKNGAHHWRHRHIAFAQACPRL